MLIVNDQKTTLFLSSALALTLLVTSYTPARADDLPSVVKSAESTAASALVPVAPTGPVALALTAAGHEATVSTSARTVGAFLIERNIHPASGDYVSAALDDPVRNGMHLTYRAAIPIVLIDGGTTKSLYSAAETVGELLAQEHVDTGPQDEVFPAEGAFLAPNEVVHVDRVAAWTGKVRQRLAPRVQERFDPKLAPGTTRTLAHGSPGVRVATVRYERRNDAPVVKKILGYEVVRTPKPRIVVHGSRPYAALEAIAAQGFAGALHFAGAALHVIATAYTSSCYGCSGVTASGVRAGLGIIAVDPRIIPLGTHLFIPGYGRAVAGDTGGAILGHRVDLGFENVAAALRFGSREVTVYVVK